jgi:hypothetical protein
LTISYLQAAAALLEPITDRILASIRLHNLSAAHTAHAPDGSAVTDSLRDGYGDNWLLAIALSALLTWGVGLAPPLLIRFAWLRRPLPKRTALGVAALFWLLNLLLFTALGSESKTHTALILVAFASYAILKSGASAPGVEMTSP